MDIGNINIVTNTISSTDTNGNIILAPDGSGAVSVTTAPIVPSGDRADSLGSATNSWDNVYADGLTFDDGTNIMANYEAPTSWTPVLAFGGGSTGITYSTQEGYYSRIGNIVWYSVFIVLTNKGSSTGINTITGLPYTPLATSSFLLGEVDYISATGGYSLGGVMGSGDTSISIRAIIDSANRVIITETSFANNSVIVGSGYYFI